MRDSMIIIAAGALAGGALWLVSEAQVRDRARERTAELTKRHAEAVHADEAQESKEAAPVSPWRRFKLAPCGISVELPATSVLMRSPGIFGFVGELEDVTYAASCINIDGIALPALEVTALYRDGIKANGGKVLQDQGSVNPLGLASRAMFWVEPNGTPKGMPHQTLLSAGADRLVVLDRFGYPEGRTLADMHGSIVVLDEDQAYLEPLSVAAKPASPAGHAAPAYQPPAYPAPAYAPGPNYDHTKPVHVHGYWKKNGTYVHEHWRERPGHGKKH